MSIQGIKLPKPIQTQSEIGFQKQQPMYKSPDGNVATKDQAFSIFHAKAEAQSNKVIRHEEAHKSAAGSQASGSPVYKTQTAPDGTKIITGGHQMINIPAMVDKTASLAQIKKTEQAAQSVIKGAEAPAAFDELSAADVSVAAKGRALQASAKTAAAQREEIDKKLAKQNNGEVPTGELTPEQEAQAKNPEKQPAGSRLNFMG